jgi:hypothetical protein
MTDSQKEVGEIIRPSQAATKQKVEPVISGLAIACLVIITAGAYFTVKSLTELRRKPENRQVAKNLLVTPTTSEPSWSSYKIITEQSLGLADYAIRVPSSWKQIEHSVNFQKTETFQDEYENFAYKLVINQEDNYNPQTEKPYETLEELSGLPYHTVRLTVGGQEATRVLPRAGSENIFKVLFFSIDKKKVLSVEMETPIDGSKTEEGEKIFSRLLESFRFISKYNKDDLGELKTVTAVIQDGSYYGPPYDPDLFQLKINQSEYLFAKSERVDLRQFLEQLVKVDYREVRGMIMGEQQLVVVESIESNN